MTLPGLKPAQKRVSCHFWPKALNLLGLCPKRTFGHASRSGEKAFSCEEIVFVSEEKTFSCEEIAFAFEEKAFASEEIASACEAEAFDYEAKRFALRSGEAKPIDRAQKLDCCDEVESTD